MKPCEYGWITEINDTLEYLNAKFQEVMDEVEKVLFKDKHICFEDIYSRIYKVCDGGIIWFIVKNKWRRLSVLVDALLFLSYLLSVIYFQGVKPNKRVRGSRRSDL